MKQAITIARICLTVVFIPGLSVALPAQTNRSYWQQEIKYRMDIDMNVESDQFTGKQLIAYKNNSPDVLDRLYFHLYFNAFQPGSSMDIRSQTIPDPDPRIGERISTLTTREQGYHHIREITQGGQILSFSVQGTILEVIPAKPIQPGQTIRLEMEYESQVPIQIRRSGRDNAEGIRYSMAQWYPKMCEYDRMGWHTEPYIAREFYGVWGDFDVTIAIDSQYTVAATGELQNPAKMRHGYGGTLKQKTAKTKWVFHAERVHDFVWAADPEFIHEQYACKNGLIIHTFYQDHESYTRHWKKLPAIMEEVNLYAGQHFGPYPYKQFSIIQGGDGGMEYPMATLITGQRPLVSLVGVTVHEFLHSWFYGVLGFNESLYYWMDEGFTNYAEILVMNHLRSKGLIPGTPDANPYGNEFKSYYAIHTRGIEEPLSTHADHFEFNTAYGFAAYTKGGILLHQLEYIMGAAAFSRGMLSFYDAWKFKHPDDIDFIRCMEKASGLELDWYREYMVMTTKTIDYAVDTVFQNGSESTIQLVNIGSMPMPLDVKVELGNGNSYTYTIPIDLMRGSKIENDPQGKPIRVLPDWKWVSPAYLLSVPYRINDIKSVSLDPQKRMADMDRDNNQWPPVPGED